MKQVTVPFLADDILSLHSGEMILLSGTIFTARDAAHKKMIQLLQNSKPLPFDLSNQLIYYCGPSPAKPGQVVGSAGPTTSSRMDSFTEELLKQGLKGMLGKGARHETIQKLIQQYQAIYLVAVGGVAALLSQAVRHAEIVAFPELGTEAIYRFQIVQFPCIVAYDCYGGDVFQTEIEKYKRIVRINEEA
jgi:fumarate hydratase subunit beta